MSIYCNYCHHYWKQKKEYDKHISCCNYFYHLRRNPRPEMDENGVKIPTHKELFRFVQELSMKCERLEKEVVRLKTNMNVKQKKVITEWLNQKEHQPKYTFEEWSKLATITENALQIVFKRDLTEGIRHVIQEFMIENRATPAKPVRSFLQKPGVIYIYSKGEWTSHPTEEAKWKIMTNEEFDNFMVMISQMFIRSFIVWQRTHLVSTEEDETNTATDAMNEKKREEEMNYLIKINGGMKSSSEKRNSELKKWFVSYIEENIQSVEYV